MKECHLPVYAAKYIDHQPHPLFIIDIITVKELSYCATEIDGAISDAYNSWWRASGVVRDDTEAGFESLWEEGTGQSGSGVEGQRIMWNGDGEESLIDTVKDEDATASAADASGERSDAFVDIDDETYAESDVCGDTDVGTARSRSITAKRQGKYSSGKVD